LNQSAGNGNGALESVNRALVTDSVRGGGQEPARRSYGLGAGVEEHEASGSVSVLCIAGLKQVRL
jgi:hypothetical protein